MIVVRTRPSGFTLIELVVTMVIIGILSVAAIPRFTGTQDFDRRSFYDETLAALRYAQKTAIAQRRNVCVTFGTSTVTLSIAGTTGNTALCAGGTSVSLASPTGINPIVTARPSVVFSLGSTTNFQFDALGRPRNASDVAMAKQIFQVSGLPSFDIVVEQETGYVHP